MAPANSMVIMAPPCDGYIRINISGRVVETKPWVLDRYPNTLLGNPQSRHQFWDPVRKEYFIDTHMPTFEAIFQFYQTGHLKRPIEVPLKTFMEQIAFFQLDTEIVNKFKRVEGILPDAEELSLPPKGVRRVLWKLFEYPSSSGGAKRLAITSVMFILLSVTSLCLETLPEYKHKDCIKRSYTSLDGNVIKLVPNFLNEFFLMETVCVSWFTFEFVIRLFTCPSIRKFFKSFMNLMDLATILPFHVTLIMMVVSGDCAAGSKSAIITCMRILRIFRIFKLSKHSRTLQIWTAALKASIHEFVLFLFFMAICSVLFAGLIYHMEKDAEKPQIEHIPQGLWWAIATITTVGYGDVVPVTRLGKLTGVACVILGVLVVALPTPVIINNFNKYYKNETGRGYEFDLENERNR